MEKQLLTMAKVAKELNLAESTARYYRDRFEKFIPSVGEGKKRRYKPETVEVLRFIVEGMKRKKSQEDIEDGLSRMFAMNMEVAEETAATTAATQQQPNNDTLQNVLEHMNAAMQIIADQKEEIAELRKQVSIVEEKQLEQQEYIESLKEHDKILMRAIRERQKAQEKKNKRWWKRWKQRKD